MAVSESEGQQQMVRVELRIWVGCSQRGKYKPLIKKKRVYCKSGRICYQKWWFWWIGSITTAFVWMALLCRIQAASVLQEVPAESVPFPWLPHWYSMSSSFKSSEDTQCADDSWKCIGYFQRYLVVLGLESLKHLADPLNRLTTISQRSRLWSFRGGGWDFANVKARNSWNRGWGFVSHHQNKYLLEIVSPIAGWCLIGTFTNPSYRWIIIPLTI